MLMMASIPAQPTIVKLSQTPIDWYIHPAMMMSLPTCKTKVRLNKV
jgi:hypothetical protein